MRVVLAYTGSLRGSAAIWWLRRHASAEVVTVTLDIGRGRQLEAVRDRALALVRISEGKEENAKSHLESWVFDLAANTWTKLNPPNEPTTSGSRARNLNFAPELNAFLLENRTHPPSGPSFMPYVMPYTFRLGHRVVCLVTKHS